MKKCLLSEALHPLYYWSPSCPPPPFLSMQTLGAPSNGFAVLTLVTIPQKFHWDRLNSYVSSDELVGQSVRLYGPANLRKTLMVLAYCATHRIL